MELKVLSNEEYSFFERHQSRKSNPFEAENYVKTIKYKGRELVFISEMELHADNAINSEKKWKVKFHAVHPDYRFVFHDKGQLHVLEPQKDTIYEFEYQKRHGLIHKERVKHFKGRKFWESQWEPEKTVKALFEFL
ncbi:hypothetical protein [Vibrio sp. Vb0587]|uniref:hypothetical protein n=1 Tax=Vibrio sp. Vb0587 TaxID=3074626 RepID=UPI002964447B|nr:hypothetical protein [Vibrio sp. Vb0587]MDW1967380.1 hypothetical protein [Vibrio sp. Vb0587]